MYLAIALLFVSTSLSNTTFHVYYTLIQWINPATRRSYSCYSVEHCTRPLTSTCKHIIHVPCDSIFPESFVQIHGCERPDTATQLAVVTLLPRHKYGAARQNQHYVTLNSL